MHLTDTELLNIKNENLDIRLNAHLNECLECRNRLENRIGFTAKLKQTYGSVNFDGQWSELANEYIKSQQENKDNQMHRKIRALQIGLFAVAACLCLVLFTPMLFNKTHQLTIESELASTIEENHQLQRSIELVNPYGSHQTVAVQTLKIRLQQIDNEIQLSYIDGLPKSEKLKLWKYRKQLLLQSIANLNSNSNNFTKSI